MLKSGHVNSVLTILETAEIRDCFWFWRHSHELSFGKSNFFLAIYLLSLPYFICGFFILSSWGKVVTSIKIFKTLGDCILVVRLFSIVYWNILLNDLLYLETTFRQEEFTNTMVTISLKWVGHRRSEKMWGRKEKINVYTEQPYLT